MDNPIVLDILDPEFIPQLEGWEECPPDVQLPATRHKSPWDPRLILDLAFGIDDLQDILLRYGLTQEAFNALSDNKIFRRELALTMRELREDGLTFARKARFQAEAYLEVIDTIVYDDAVAPSVKLEAIKSTVQWGGLIQKEQKSESANATQINVNISF